MSTSGNDPYQLFGRWAALWATTATGSMLAVAMPAALIFDLSPEAFTTLCALLACVVSPWASYVIVYSPQRRTTTEPPRRPPDDHPEPPRTPSPPSGHSTVPEHITHPLAPAPGDVADHAQGSPLLPAGTYQPLTFLPEPGDPPPPPLRKRRTIRLIGVIR